ncbi:hypothetical protein ILYODFUR_008997 [Ilyodon furcidens]|uniref:Uncharacterized protein n=1 Tax=Ilyodon furcidens TaxID=33524 RepID=A0ABV0TU87_9TELE
MPRIPSPQHRGTPPQMSSIPEKPKTTPHTARLQVPPPHPGPHHTARRDGNARAPRNATPARADTTEHRAHNGTPDPTLRWDKLTQQEVPGQQQASRGWRPPPHPLQPHKHTTSPPLQR